METTNLSVDQPQTALSNVMGPLSTSGVKKKHRNIISREDAVLAVFHDGEPESG